MNAQLKEASQSLLPLEAVNAVELFGGGSKLDELLQRIREETATVVPDIDTPEGRKAVASLAYKVARSKTALDDAGKGLVAEWKMKAAQIDVHRKRARDYLDALKDEIRKPLDDWEAEQQRIEQEEIARLQREREEAERQRLAELERREAEIRERERVIAEQEAAAAAKAEAEQAERDRATREAEIRREAEERATREAAEAVQRAEQAAEEARQEAARAAEQAEASQREAVRQAEQRAQDEAERRERDRLAEEERQRQAAEAQRLEEDRKAANRNHQRAVNAAALAALVKGGLDEGAGKTALELIIGGHIPAVSIRY